MQTTSKVFILILILSAAFIPLAAASNSANPAAGAAPSTVKALDSVPVGAIPLTGAYDSQNRLVYVVDEQFPGLTAINGTNWAYTFTVCTGSFTYAFAGIRTPDRPTV